MYTKYRSWFITSDLLNFLWITQKQTQQQKIYIFLTRLFIKYANRMQFIHCRQQIYSTVDTHIYSYICRAKISCSLYDSSTQINTITHNIEKQDKTSVRPSIILGIYNQTTYGHTQTKINTNTIYTIDLAQSQKTHHFTHKTYKVHTTNTTNRK